MGEPLVNELERTVRNIEDRIGEAQDALANASLAAVEQDVTKQVVASLHQHITLLDVLVEEVHTALDEHERSR